MYSFCKYKSHFALALSAFRCVLISWYHLSFGKESSRNLRNKKCISVGLINIFFLDLIFDKFFKCIFFVLILIEYTKNSL